MKFTPLAVSMVLSLVALAVLSAPCLAEMKSIILNPAPHSPMK